MSRQEFKLPLDIARVDRSNLLPALESVRGCLKTTSMLWMHALGLPVLQGIVVSDWSDDSALTVKRFCRRGHLTMLLLRIDKPHERWTRRRGGYLVPLKDVGESVTELKRHGMIAALLEPASPYADQYSLAGVTAPVDGKMTVEIVGPGFDASDILRGDLPAQERWEVSFTAMRSNRSVRESISCRRVHVLTPTQYL